MQPQELLDRCEYTIKYQMQEIDRLRAELERRDDELKQLIEWINGDADALATLQRTYMDPRPRLRETAGGELFSKPLKGQNCSLYAHGRGRWRYMRSADVDEFWSPPPYPEVQEFLQQPAYATALGLVFRIVGRRHSTS